MGRSIFLRRIVALLGAALLLSGTLTMLLYAVVMRNVYLRTQAKELLPIAHSIAEFAADWGEDGILTQGIGPLLERESQNFFSARLYIFDAQGNSLESMRNGRQSSSDREGGKDGPVVDGPPSPFSASPADAGSPPGHDEELIPILDAVLSGQETTVLDAGARGNRFLAVGVPVLDDNGGVLGAIIFTRPVADTGQTLRGMRAALGASIFFTFLVMLFPTVIAARKLTTPLLQMRDVSLHMAKGDFSRRADEDQKGEIGELARSINRFAEESQRLEKTRRDYVANVSHELRTPISAIRAMSETLSDGIIQNEEKKRQYYSLILRESMRLSRLVNDLLELSRLQSGAVALKKTVFPLTDILGHCAEVYGEMAADSGITLSLEPGLEGLGQVYSNPDRVEQVLVALLDNAIAHTPEGGAASLGAADMGGRMEVWVRNEGAGIPAEDLPYVFDRFYKVDKSHSSGGTGLGLSIAAEVLRLLGEEIRVESEAEKGCRFTFTIEKGQGADADLS